MIYLDWVYYLLLLVICIGGLAINILGLPGLWVMVLGAVVYGWVTGWTHVGLWGLVTLTGLAALAEVVEFLAGSAGAKTAGSSKRGMMGAIVGGFVGGIVGSFVIPLPPLGTIVGAVAGSFVGAGMVEYGIGKSAGDSLRVGVGAAKGRFWGIVSKTAIGLVMLVVVIVAAIPVRGRVKATAPPKPTTAPATAPVK